MTRRSTRIATATTLVLVVASMVTGCLGDEPERTFATGADSNTEPKLGLTTVQTPAPNDPPSPAQLSERTRLAMEGQGSEIRPVDETKARPSVSQEAAAAKAAAEFGFVNERKPSEAALAVVTNRVYTERVDRNDPNSPTRLVINDRLTWVIVFDKVTVPFHGGPNVPAEMRARISRRTYQDTFMVLIDAMTGEYLRAESVSYDLGEPDIAPSATGARSGS